MPIDVVAYRMMLAKALPATFVDTLPTDAELHAGQPIARCARQRLMQTAQATPASSSQLVSTGKRFCIPKAGRARGHAGPHVARGTSAKPLLR